MNRDLDIVVSHVLENAHPAVLVEHEIEVGNIIVAHPKHAMFRGAEPTVKDVVLKTPMAIPVLEQHYKEMVLKKYGIDFDRLPGRVICSDFELLIRLVASRPWYFTAGPTFAFGPELAEGKLRKLNSPVPFGHRAAIHTNREALSLPAVARVHQVVREVYLMALGLPAAT